MENERRSTGHEKWRVRITAIREERNRVLNGIRCLPLSKHIGERGPPVYYRFLSIFCKKVKINRLIATPPTPSNNPEHNSHPLAHTPDGALSRAAGFAAGDILGFLRRDRVVSFPYPTIAARSVRVGQEASHQLEFASVQKGCLLSPDLLPSLSVANRGETSKTCVGLPTASAIRGLQVYNFF